MSVSGSSVVVYDIHVCLSVADSKRYLFLDEVDELDFSFWTVALVRLQLTQVSLFSILVITVKLQS